MEWIVFYIKGSEVFRMTVEGSFAGETQATAELLAYEHDVQVSEVSWRVMREVKSWVE